MSQPHVVSTRLKDPLKAQLPQTGKCHSQNPIRPAPEDALTIAGLLTFCETISSNILLKKLDRSTLIPPFLLQFTMMQVTSLLRYSGLCPFLGHSTASSLRSLASTTANNVSGLTSTAMKCPMMGPNLAAIAQARTYASVADPRDVAEMHKVSIPISGKILDRSDAILGKAYSLRPDRHCIW